MGINKTTREPGVRKTGAHLDDSTKSSFRKYQELVIGTSDLWTFLKYELITMLLGSIPGSLGLFLRGVFYKYIFKELDRGVIFGRNVVFRHPDKIRLGRVAIDDNCLIDAKGAGDAGIQIGDDVLIARDTIIQGKASWVTIGDRCIIGSQCQLSSAGGISLGKSVMLAGQCYIGGGRYRTDNREIPMMDQGPYSEGPVVIEDDVWLGAGVVVLDGVRIGRGCVVGAGAVVRQDIPEYTIATPHQKLVMLPRSQE